MPFFLQTPEWAKFQEALGRRTFFIYGEPGRTIGGGNWRGLLIEHKLPLGKNYLYCPRGPAYATTNDQRPTTNAIEEFLKKTAELAEQEKSIFLRWDVPFEKNSQFAIRNSQFRIYPTKSIQPQHTLLINLTKSEEELLADMHEKTRYNVRLAERRGVIVHSCPIGQECTKALEVFWKLLQDTTDRDGFSAHTKTHYEKLVEIFSPSPQNQITPGPIVRLYVAEYQEMPLAMALIVLYAGTATYLHGASSNEHRDVMAPHLLHWRIMQDAKKDGYTAYDFWGINPSTPLGAGDKNPHWAGITRFKLGFGGTEFSYADSVDVVFHGAWYGVYCVAKKIPLW